MGGSAQRPSTRYGCWSACWWRCRRSAACWPRWSPTRTARCRCSPSCSPPPAPMPRNLAAICRHPGLAVACRGLREQQLYAHWPGVPVQAAPALLLLLSAYGLRRGRRLAWWLAMVINLTVLAAGIRLGYAVGPRLGVYVAEHSRPGAGRSSLPREAMLLPVVTLISAAGHPPPLRPDRRPPRGPEADGHRGRRARRELRRVPVARLPAARPLQPAVAGSAGSAGAAGVVSAGQAVRQSPPPQDLAGRLLFGWVFLLFWIVVLGALTAFFLHTCTFHDAAEADQARAILTRGGSTLSYMSTWPGNKYWFSPDGRAAIAYRAIATIAVTVGEPRRPGRARFRDHGVRQVLRAPRPAAMPVQRHRAVPRGHAAAGLDLGPDRRGHPAPVGAPAIHGKEMAGRAGRYE